MEHSGWMSELYDAYTHIVYQQNAQIHRPKGHVLPHSICMWQYTW